MSEPKCNDKGVIVRKWETEITIAFGIVANAKREENEFTNPQAGRQFLMTGFLHT